MSTTLKQRTFIVISLAACIAGTQAIELQRKKVNYNHDVAADAIDSNSDCSAAELSFVDAAVDATILAIEYSLANENAELFTKWFGTSTAASDGDVRSRMNEATYVMRQRGEAWNPMCCKSGKGACGNPNGPTCEIPNVLAWVMSSSYDNFQTKESSTRIRLCPALMASTDPLIVGFTLYHELIHVVSHVGDADVGYARDSLVNLASDNAEAARLSANNYMLYTAQNGLSYEDYSGMALWGMAIHDPGCLDKHQNCHDMAKDCCNNASLIDRCCASCRVIDSTQACIDLNGVPANGFTEVYSDSYGEHELDNGQVPDGPTPPEDYQTAADGQLCCGDTCSESWDCFSGLICSQQQGGATHNICWSENATTNMLVTTGPVCDECTVKANAARLGGGNACYESCQLNEDCGAGMFCCSAYETCMDTSTLAPYGVNCVAHAAAVIAIAASDAIAAGNPVPDCLDEQEFTSGTAEYVRSTSRPIDDLRTDWCVYYAEDGNCLMDHYMLINCKSSCGLCPGQEYNKVPLTNCKNVIGDESCDYFAKIGRCESSPEAMNEQCKKSCGLCEDNSNAPIPDQDENPVPDQDENPVPDCKNNSAYGDSTCDYYAGIGYCDTEKDFMNENCKKSCGTCGDNSNASVPEEDENPVADCQNNQEYGDATCDYYAKEKYCESEPTFMNAYCAKSCGQCSDNRSM